MLSVALADCRVFFVTLSVIMPSVIMLNVVEPLGEPLIILKDLFECNQFFPQQLIN